MPILAAFAASPSATALLMFPTKALAQDQLGALKSLLAAAFGPEAADWAEVRTPGASYFDPALVFAGGHWAVSSYLP